MDEITQTQNLNSHYTTVAKVTKPQHVVVNGPDNIPKHHTYTDKEANERLASLNQDVYESIQRTPKKNNKKFLGLF